MIKIITNQFVSVTSVNSFQYALLFLITAVLQGCATPYSQFYTDRTGGLDLTKSDSVILTAGEPKLIRGSTPENDLIRMLEDGYSLIGTSSFNASEASDRGAIDQAKKVHASIVIVYSKYTGTTTGVMPLNLPDNRISTTNLTGSAYGPSGYANYTGTATTTSYGTQTALIPFAVNRADYFASYWVKIKPPALGLSIQPMTTDIIQKIGTNKGVLINAVIKGTPAFDVDILRGDVLSKIGDAFVYDGDSFQRAIKSNEGMEVKLLLYRDGKEITKTLRIRSRG